MKKRTLLASIALLTGLLTFSFQASAQITIDQSDLPSAGLIVGTQKDTAGIAVLPGSPSSSAQTWDFSSLVGQKPALVKFENESSSPYSATFSAANLADSTIGVDGYNFFSASTSDFAVEGAEENIAFTYTVTMVTYHFQVEINLTPTFEQSALPATYNSNIKGVSSGSETFNQSIVIFTQERLATNINYSDTVDAWGTLKMPNGITYPVLRQKHNEVDIDSIYGYYSPSWIFVERTITYKNQYDWYAKGLGYILAEMDMDTTSSTVKDVIWDTTTMAPSGINEISNSGKTAVYPNPCGSQIDFSSTDQNVRYVTVFDMTGRQLDRLATKNGTTILNTTMYANGMYFYQLTDNNGALLDKGKFTVQK